jgi:EAL domain-containing protein (putative c-di-GMP-specific phosphodiesterase class I)
MRNERESVEIVNALIGLGHGLGLTVTAEGIEAPGQQSDLIASGCQQGQGYLFGKAMAAPETLALFMPQARETGAASRAH